MPRGVQRKSAQQAGNAVGYSRRFSDGFRLDAGEYLRGKSEQDGRCSPRIGFQIGNPRHRFVVEIEPPRLDKIAKLGRGELMALDGRKQRTRDRIGTRLAAPFAAQDIAPPLQADFAGQRFARNLAHARHFAVESVKRMQRSALFGRSEQGGDIAVAVGCPHKLGAIGECILHEFHTTSPRCAERGSKNQSIAISPAPTRRLSISMTL